MPFAIGVDLGGTHTKAALVAEDGTTLTSAKSDTPAEDGPDAVVGVIATLVEDVAGSLPEGEKLDGIGVGAPGPVSRDRTTVRRPPNLVGWRDVSISDALAAALSPSVRQRMAVNAPILAENDANVAALGSAFYGAGLPHDSFVMVTLGTGVGGAIIHENRLFRGATGAAGEIGHMTIDYEGPYARSGVAGALEAYLGHKFLTRHARYQLLTRPTCLHAMTEDDLADLDPITLHRAAMGGDPAALEFFSWAGHKLGAALGSIVNLLDIRTFVIGGGVSAAGDVLLNPVRDSISRYVMPGMRGDILVICETRGNAVAVQGAARLVFEYVEDHA
ncbi:MAG: ROK family protein [Bacteroidota bacterium]